MENTKINDNVIEGEFSLPLKSRVVKDEKENTMMNKGIDKLKEIKTGVVKFAKKHKVAIGVTAVTLGALAGVAGLAAHCNRYKRDDDEQTNTIIDTIDPIHGYKIELLDNDTKTNEESNEINDDNVEEIDDTITEDFEDNDDNDIVDN